MKSLGQSLPRRRPPLIISVNSWGYTTSPGMAEPKLSGTSAACVFTAAKLSGNNRAVNCS